MQRSTAYLSVENLSQVCVLFYSRNAPESESSQLCKKERYVPCVSVSLTLKDEPATEVGHPLAHGIDHV